MAEANPQYVSVNEFATDVMEYFAFFKFKLRPRSPCSDSPFKKEMGSAAIRFMYYFRENISQITKNVWEALKEGAIVLEDLTQILVNNLREEYVFLELISTCAIVGHLFITHYHDSFTIEVGRSLIVSFFHRIKIPFLYEGSWPNFNIYCTVYSESLGEHVMASETMTQRFQTYLKNDHFNLYIPFLE